MGGDLVSCGDVQALAAAAELLRNTGDDIGLTRPIKISANGLDGLDHLPDAYLPTERWQQPYDRWAIGAP